MASEDPSVKELAETLERLTRRMNEISEMDNAIRMSLEDSTLITEEVEDALEFGDTILNVQLEIRNFLERKRGIEVQHPARRTIVITASDFMRQKYLRQVFLFCTVLEYYKDAHARAS